MKVTLPPLVASETSSRLLTHAAELRNLFNYNTVSLSGKELETLLSSIYLAGWSDGIDEACDYAEGSTSVLLDWAEKQSR
jgi:hypothetical protein